MTTVNPGNFKAYHIRGLFGDDNDAASAQLIGRSFVRVIADLEGKPAAELRLALGHDMRLTAPELAAAYREGMVSEGAVVVDAGEVGTEMLYFLVGSRDLDGGRATPGSATSAPTSRAVWATRPAAAASRRSRSMTSSTST